MANMAPSPLLSPTSNGSSVIEYTYTTDPEWAGDAIICTDSGIELNFEKLNDLCLGGSLPTNISVHLIGSHQNSVEAVDVATTDVKPHLTNGCKWSQCSS